MNRSVSFERRFGTRSAALRCLPTASLLLLLLAGRGEAQSYRILHAFGTNTMGFNPLAALAQDLDGTLYGVTSAGGQFNSGQVFRLSTDGSSYSVLKNLGGMEGEFLEARLVLSGATLYGSARYGGSTGRGTLFKLNTDGSGFVVLKDFAYGATNGLEPATLLLSGGTLYGTTLGGGAFDSGVIFKLNPDGSGYTVLKHLDSLGCCPQLGVVGSETNLFGTTSDTLFSMHADGTDFTVLRRFSNGVEGSYPKGGLVLDGTTLYGTTSQGGPGSGTVFKISTDGSGLTVLLDFTEETIGAAPAAGLTLAGSTLFGTTELGGVYSRGAVFKVDTDGSNASALVQFRGGDGQEPGEMVMAGSTFFGVTHIGGAVGNGTVYRIEADGSGYAVLKDFTNDLEGVGLYCRLVTDGSTVYGSANGGGSSWGGTLFKLNSNGSGFTVLKDFTNYLEGVNPWGALALSGSILYGTTTGGGASNAGTIFRIGTDGGGYAVLRDFTYATGRDFSGSMVAEGRLYGTTEGGGNYNTGTIFSLGTNGSDFTVLRSFGGSDGEWAALPIVSGGTFYGTCEGGGNGYGTIFRINTDGSGFASFSPFDWTTLSPPEGSLAVAGSTLYGITGSQGGLFQINTDGTGFTILKRLSARDGYYARGGVILSGTSLFGTTGYGGAADGGVIFSFSLAPNITVLPESRTVEAGGSVSLALEAAGGLPMAYQWYFDGTNVLTGCDSNVLQLAGVALDQSGAYTLVASNSFGCVTSAPVMVQVIPVVERRLVPGVRLTGQTGELWNVASSGSLGAGAAWNVLGQISLADPTGYCFDTGAPLPVQRFYTASTPQSNALPASLSLRFVMAITLHGAVGDQVRIDSINPVGPIDAWATLGTATLTNISQFYFDLSDLPGPGRLYRVIQVGGAGP